MDTRYLKDRYVNPYTDFGFKKLFGTEINKDLLISFINSLLHGKEVVKDLTYLNTEHLGTGESDRKAVFDVYCENENGEKILVEMQRGEQQFFKDRTLFYTTFPIREQQVIKDWDYQLKAIYVIGILNFKFDKVHDNYYHHEVQLLDVETKEVFYDKLTFIYLEMPKFNKSEDELNGMFEKWLFRPAQPFPPDGTSQSVAGTYLHPSFRNCGDSQVHESGIRCLRGKLESLP